MSSYVRRTDNLIRSRESRDDRIRRLAREANHRHIMIGCVGSYYTATEPGAPARHHTVTRLSCDCYCFIHTGCCAHHAALLVHLGDLPDPSLAIVSAAA